MANTLACLTAAAALFASVGSLAYAGGTEREREACTPDAFRLCTSAMPDEGRVENCLRNAGPRLSRACYDVFYPPTESNQAQMTRGQALSRERMQAPSMPQVPPASDNDE